VNTVFNAALKYLSAKNLTESELRVRLENEFASLADVDEQVNNALKRLNELHLINDSFIANSQAERYQHKGNRFIKQRLKQKGVDEQSIEQALDALPDEHERAFEAARRKWRSLNNETKQAKDNKLLRFLSGRGFSSAVCYQVLEEMEDEYQSYESP